MPEIPKRNFPVNCHEAHAELLAMEKGTVWQSLQPISRENYARLVLPTSLVPIGIGKGVMDEHYFR